MQAAPSSTRAKPTSLETPSSTFKSLLRARNLRSTATPILPITSRNESMNHSNLGFCLNFRRATKPPLSSVSNSLCPSYRTSSDPPPPYSTSAQSSQLKSWGTREESPRMEDQKAGSARKADYSQEGSVNRWTAREQQQNGTAGIQRGLMNVDRRMSEELRGLGF